MRNILLLFIFLFTHTAIYAQESTTDLVKSLNNYITQHSADNPSPFVFFEKTGILEQVLNESTSQRIRLSEIANLKVESNEVSYSVSIRCADNLPCINLIKNSINGASIPSNAFFFTDLESANMFAKKFEQLLAKYHAEKSTTVSNELLKVNEENKPIQQIPVKENTTIKSNKEASKAIIEDEEEDLDSDERHVQKGRKVVKDVEDSEDELDKKDAHLKRKKKADIEDDEDPLDNPLGNSNTRKKTKGNTEESSEATDMQSQICKQLFSIIDAGKKTKFKDIEGKETNASTKINESKIKLKGTKRSYLSWFKKERAFIGEYKTSKDRELILIEFEHLQTELEDCLEAGWDNIDHSQDEMYTNVSDEVKDVEYKLISDPQMPSLRIMINKDDKGMNTLFVRIQ